MTPTGQTQSETPSAAQAKSGKTAFDGADESVRILAAQMHAPAGAVPDFDSRDWFLQSLIELVNGREIEIGLTLQTGGLLVSGLLVSGHQYFEGFGAEFARAFDDPALTENIRQAYARYGGIYMNEKTPNDSLPRAHYVHLKDARFFSTSGKPIPENMAVWWRGRVSEVDGFFLGLLSSQD